MGLVAHPSLHASLLGHSIAKDTCLHVLRPKLTYFTALVSEGQAYLGLAYVHVFSFNGIALIAALRVRN